MTQVFASLLCSLFALLLFGSISPVSAQVDPYSISHVDIVFMNHLDIGFDGIDPTIGYAFNVINKYFDEYFPKAINTANEVRDLTVGLLHFVYTTHPYLVSLYLNCPTTWVYPSPGMAPNSSVPMKLHCPSASAVEAFKAAIMRGDIAWHAMPFNAEPEVVDDSMFTALLKMAKDLDKQFNKTSVMTMSQRDVPGMTRGVVPLLRKNGIEAITVGVNSASAPPAVPNLFVWKDVASNTDVIGMWHPGGYGGTDVSDCVTFPGFDRALAFAFRSDNKGPQNTLEALEVFASVQEEFPFARVNGATYDDFVQHVIPIKSKLPVITSEIGDTWIYGVPSDPLKVAQFREILRLRKSCLTSKQCDVNDQAFNLFDRLLMKVSEHTWGLDVKTFLDDFVNWANPQFNKAKSVLPGYKLMTNSWLEQRSFITNAILQLKLDSKYRNFASQIESKLATLTPSGPPSVSGWQKVASSNFNQIFSCGNFDLRFDATSGAIVGLLEKKTGIHWASPENQLAVYRMQSYNQDSYDRFFANYMYCSWEDCGDWAPKDFGKPNVSLAHVKEKTFTTTLKDIYTKTDSSGYHFRLEQTLPPLASQQVGGAQSVWVSIDIYPAGGPSKIDVSLYLIKKTPTRIPEAHWFSFAPVAKNSSDSWKFSKLGSLISPVDVVMNGSRHLHGIDDGGVILDRKSSGKLTINSKDAAVVSYGLLSAFPTPLDARIPSANSGVHFSLYNNVWGTNYIMWYPYYPQDANIQYRFSLDFSS